MENKNNINENPHCENKNFYQRIATNSTNDGTKVACGYFETLQHQAGIQSNRKNGYYVKSTSAKDENIVCKNDVQTQPRVIEEKNATLPKLESDLDGHTIDDIFNFDNNETNQYDELFYTKENFELLSDNDFYNDFFASDNAIDNENRTQYQQGLQTLKNEQYAQNQHNQNTQVINNFMNEIDNIKHSIRASDEKIDSDKNKKIILICSIVIGFLLIIVLALFFISDAINEKNKQNINLNNDYIESISEKNESIFEIIRKNNQIVCFAKEQISIYSDINFTMVIEKLDAQKGFLIDKSKIGKNYVVCDNGYIKTSDLYVYNGTLDEFQEENLSYFEVLDEKTNLKNLIQQDTNISQFQEESENILVTIPNVSKDFVDKDEYCIDVKDSSSSNIDLIGDFGKEIANKDTDETLFIELYNGEYYGNLVIESVGIDAKLHYGSSQNNIDLYDVCSSENFSIPGMGKSILIGGHSTNSFSKLECVKNNDIITITTKYGVFQYRVFYTGIGEIVSNNPSPNDYLKSIETGEELFFVNEDSEILNLYTCYYPNGNEISPTPYRFAVKAKKISFIFKTNSLN